ncbi:circadian clock-controlled protein daywake-like [Rhagoletis pomonella]|uniref:circadian clock-controlled protein daywake-like n=2 Tax=Rhagoletis pomonella TaxID=28610 RepID=UPI001780F177|nr:circadian clock-controlled protein daywake-like [Rhagoletis pomonella]
MKSKTLTVLIIFGVCYQFTNGDLPSEIEKCHAGDVDCIAKTLPFILQNYAQGIPEIGLTDIEKLSLDDVVLTKANPHSGVSLNLEFKKMYLHGISNLTVQRIVGFEKDPLNSKFEIYITIPNLVVDGEYISSGKVLILPMDATGYAKIKLKNSKLSLKFKSEEVRKDGKQFIKIKDLKCKLTPELMKVKFENLFNGNEQLANSLNQLINDNWKVLYSDMEDQINDAVAKIVKRLLAGVLRVLPYDEFYGKD